MWLSFVARLVLPAAESVLAAAKRRSGLRPALALSLLLVLTASALGQTRRAAFRITAAADSVIVLPNSFVVPSTLRLTLDSNVVLIAGQDFTFDTSNATIHLTPAIQTLLWSGTAPQPHTLVARYTALPFQIDRSYSLYTVEPAGRDTLTDSSGQARHITAAEPTTEAFLGNLQRSGSISRGFQLGSNRDLSLTSGFNLQFSGDLAEDVTVTGALSEESTPIQPEGTTQTLQDIDRIFITVKAGEHFGATLGDFYTNLNAPQNIGQEFQSMSPLGISTGHSDPFTAFAQSNFDILTRKLLGAQASLNYRQGGVTIVGASARGQHTTNTFQGQEAFQGPYRLTGKNGERAIIIVAGSERVYVDGILQTRGERNDYIIDYSLGEITFEPRRLITAESRITVDFEYSDQQYSRSLVAGTGTARMFNDRVSFTATYMREGDNPDVPLDLSLSDTDRTILARAGNDRLAATKTGVIFAGRDLGGHALGSYVRIDSVIGGVHRTVYLYSPLDTVNALYNVTFGYAGTNNGSYTRQGIGQFTFVGTGLGDYDTLRYLPLPELDQVVAVHGMARITDNLGITGEFATSAFDQNRLSELPSQVGNAYRFGALFADTIALLGYTELRLTDRFVGDRFRPLDRTQDVEFLRRYGNDQPQSSTPNVGEETREATLLYRPTNALQFDATYGSLTRPLLGFSSSRTYAKAEVFEDTVWRPHVVGSIETLPTSDISIAESAKWNRAFAEASKTIGSSRNAFTIGARFGYEEKRAFALGAPSDSLTASSFGYRSYGPFAKLALNYWISLSGDVTRRDDDSVRSAALTAFSRATTERATMSFIDLGGFSANLDVTLRDKRYIDTLAKTQNGGDQETKLLRFEPHYQLRSGGLGVDALYEISDQRSAKQERVFLPVQAGYGTYKYLGDLNHNGKPDPNEFEIARYQNEATYVLVTVPTEQLYPVTDLRTNVRFRVAPRDLLAVTDSSSAFARAIGAISSETFVQINETSRDENPNDIYFLRLSHFLNPETTVKGSFDFEQDINVLETNPVHSYRLHFLERKNAGQFNTGLERTYLAERSVRVRLRPTFEFLGETILQSGTDLAESDSLSLNRPHNTGLLSGSTDWTYHPVGSPFDYSLRLEAGQAIEHSTTPEIKALTNAITARTSYALETQARLRAELERDELTLDGSLPSGYLLPYALTGGRSSGVTWLWRLSIDYQFASGIVATLSYDGRNEAISTGDRQTVHNARAEVRASF